MTQQPYQQHQQLSQKTLKTDERTPNLLRVGLLLLGFGIAGYCWIKISRALVAEIEG